MGAGDDLSAFFFERGFERLELGILLVVVGGEAREINVVWRGFGTRHWGKDRGWGRVVSGVCR